MIPSRDADQGTFDEGRLACIFMKHWVFFWAGSWALCYGFPEPELFYSGIA